MTDAPATTDHSDCNKKIETLTDEVRKLKRLLAARPANDDMEERTGRKVKRAGGDDWMDTLAPADREWWQRRNGGGRKK